MKYNSIDDIESEDFTIDWENSSDSFHFGYRLVRFVDGTFGYVKKGNGEEICPFKFDIASEFNEYGLAMIGKNGCVNWIDHNFEYLSMSGNKISCKNVLRENILRGGEWEFLSVSSIGFSIAKSLCLFSSPKVKIYLALFIFSIHYLRCLLVDFTKKVGLYI